MSSTNRGAVRQADDFYETPGWCVRAILPHLPLHGGKSGRILEPGCGRGAIIRELIADGVDPDRIHGVELDMGRAANCVETTRVHVHRGNFLEFPWNNDEQWGDDPWTDSSESTLTIGNPPFELAMSFIQRSFTLAMTTALLLRLNFLGSQERAAWHRDNPSDVYILPKRPGFMSHLKPGDTEERCPFQFQLRPTSARTRCDRVSRHDGPCLKAGTDSCEYA